MRKVILLSVVFLFGCANFDVDKFRDAVNQSYQRQDQQRQMNAYAAMMQASGPSRIPVSNGQVLAAGINAYNAADQEWDWDGFYNEYRQIVWACRGVQTGQFAFDERCAFKTKTDYRWPEK